MQQPHDLMRELNAVARRVLPRVFQKLGKEGSLELPHLRAVAERAMPGAWDVDPLDALERLLRLAISQLEGSFTEKISNQYAAYILYNFDNSASPKAKSIQLEGIGSTWHSHIFTRLRSEADPLASPSNIRRKVNNLRRSLARIMLSPDFERKPEVVEADANAQVATTDTNSTWFHLLVGEPADKDVAIRYVTENIPQATPEEAELLIESLCLHACLIVKAVDFLKENEEVSAQDLSHSIARDAALAVDTIQSGESRLFRVVPSLRRLVEKLDEEHPYSLVLLELLTFGLHHSVSFELAGAYLLEQKTISNAESTHASFAIKRALSPLLEYGVVQTINASILIDRLAQDIFASLLKDHLENFLRKAYEIQCESFNELWDAGWSPFAVATRKTFAEIVIARLADRQDGFRRRKAGEFGGPEWANKAGALWLAHFVSAVPTWKVRHYRDDSGDELDDMKKWYLTTGLGALQKGDEYITYCLFLALSKSDTRAVEDFRRDAAPPLSFEDMQQGIVNIIIESIEKRLAIQGIPKAEIEKEIDAEINRVREHIEGMRGQYDAIVAGIESPEGEGSQP